MRERSQGLDVVRSVAISSVVLFHISDYFKYGYLGVDLFFLLSGYLMSRYVVRGQLDSPVRAIQYFIRRGFRIWPAYFVYLGFIYFLHYTDKIALNSDVSISSLVLYYYNYTSSFDPFVGHLWSLCIEEHFYIMLPFLTYFGYKLFHARHRVYYFSFLTIIFIIVSVIAGSAENPFTTHFRVFELFLGVVVGLLPGRWSVKGVVKHIIFPVCLILFLGLMLPFTDIMDYTTRMYLSAGICVLLVYSAEHVRSWGNYFYSRLSNMSYSLYLYHVPILLLVENIFTGLALTLLAAWISRKFIEKPFLKWRDNLFSSDTLFTTLRYFRHNS